MHRKACYFGGPFGLCKARFSLRNNDGCFLNGPTQHLRFSLCAIAQRRFILARNVGRKAFVRAALCRGARSITRSITQDQLRWEITRAASILPCLDGAPLGVKRRHSLSRFSPRAGIAQAIRPCGTRARGLDLPGLRRWGRWGQRQWRRQWWKFRPGSAGGE
jgi:hypothetical protein